MMTKINSVTTDAIKEDALQLDSEVSTTVSENAANINEGTLAKKKKRKKNEAPGRLSGSIPFEIHTADAQAIFSGYSSKAAVGLLQFGGQMTKIWDAVEKDDPYADWYLLKVYDGIVKLRHQLTTCLQDYQEKMSQTYGDSNLQLTPFASVKPVVKSLWFRTQYGYLGAKLINDFDALMRTVLTANRVGVLLDETHEAIKIRWQHKIDTLFKLPFQWQSLAITRQDMAANNELSQQAESLMGKLPAQVQDKTLRSPFAPAIKVLAQVRQLAMDFNVDSKAEN